MPSKPVDHGRAFGGAMFGAALAALASFAILRADPDGLTGVLLAFCLPVLAGGAGALILGPQNPPTFKDACFVGLYAYLIVCVALLLCNQPWVFFVFMGGVFLVPLSVLGAIVGAGILTKVHNKLLMRSRLVIPAADSAYPD